MKQIIKQANNNIEQAHTKQQANKQGHKQTSKEGNEASK